MNIPKSLNQANKAVPANSLICGKNVYFSRESEKTWNNNNALVVGTSGTGKSWRYVEPALLQADSSYLVSDPKGTLYKKYAPYFNSLGYSVHKMDFIHPERSEHWNPILYCKNTQDVLKASYSLVYNSVDEYHSYDPFWDQMTTILFSAFIGYLVEAEYIPQSDKNFSYIRKLITEMGRDKLGLSKIKNRLRQHNEWMLDNHGKESWAYNRYLQVDVVPDKTYGTIIGTTNAKMAFFDTEELQEMLSSNDIDFTELGKKKTIIFVEISDSDRSMDTLVNLFYSQLVNTLCSYADECCPNGALPVPVQLILDDFGTNAKIDNFDRIISNIRSRNISAMLFVQSEEQLCCGYGGFGGKTISNNCSTIVYLGGSDPALAEYMSRRMGKEPYDILTMPNKTAFVFRRGREPIFCELFDTEWFKKELGFEDGKPLKKSDKRRGVKADEDQAKAAPVEAIVDDELTKND